MDTRHERNRKIEIIQSTLYVGRRVYKFEMKANTCII